MDISSPISTLIKPQNTIEQWKNQNNMDSTIDVSQVDWAKEARNHQLHLYSIILILNQFKGWEKLIYYDRH